MSAMRVMLFALCLCVSGIVWAQPVNINTASQDQLTQLSGIGPKKAQAIVDYREAHGDFKSADDLTQVKGIGPKTLSEDRAMITVSDDNASASGKSTQSNGATSGDQSAD